MAFSQQRGVSIKQLFMTNLDIIRGDLSLDCYHSFTHSAVCCQCTYLSKSNLLLPVGTCDLIAFTCVLILFLIQLCCFVYFYIISVDSSKLIAIKFSCGKVVRAWSAWVWCHSWDRVPVNTCQGSLPSSTGEKDTGPRQGGKYHGYDVSKSPQAETFHISDYCFTYINPSDKRQGHWCLDSSCRNIPY